MSGETVTIKDIAKRAGVSTATVSHVINNTRYVSEDVSQRVMKAMKEMDYRSNYLAKALRSNCSHTIGVIIPDITNHAFARIVHALEVELNRSGYSIILGNSRDELQREQEQFERLRSWRVDGIVMVPASPDFDYGSLYSKDCPILFVDRRPNTERYSGIFSDVYPPIFAGIEQLIESGHRRIACLTGEIRFSVQDRLNAFSDALAKHEVPMDSGLMPGGPSTIESGYERMEYICRATDATAVFVANRLLSMGCMQYVADHNIAVPDRMAILSFGCYDWRRITHPRLSTVLDPIDQMGMAAGQMMLTFLKNPEAEENRVVMNAYLTDRTSY